MEGGEGLGGWSRKGEEEANVAQRLGQSMATNNQLEEEEKSVASKRNVGEGACFACFWVGP